ncbi:MAG: LD-carboxypeptidase [Candidatus Korobacteraceae bacterium]
MQTELQSGRRVRALGPHSKAGVVSPASCVDRAALEAGCRALSELSGWQVATSPVALQSEGGFAGSAAARAVSLMETWQRDDVDAVICARGGYGSNYLLPLLDFDALRMNPKPFVGYSDNTSLLLALERTGMVAFHGPMVASDFARGTADELSLRAALGGEALDLRFSAGSPVQPLVAGEARGTLTGGCLSVVVTSLGTPWEIETWGKILFLEDVNEKPYRIDRMLMHLLLAGKFHGVRGIVFGAMLGCAAAPEDEETLPRMMVRVLGGLGIPIAIGFPSGHVESGNITLPFGVPAALVCSKAGVRLQVEPATFIATHNSKS